MSLEGDRDPWVENHGSPWSLLWWSEYAYHLHSLLQWSCLRWQLWSRGLNAVLWTSGSYIKSTAVAEPRSPLAGSHHTWYVLKKAPAPRNLAFNKMVCTVCCLKGNTWGGSLHCSHQLHSVTPTFPVPKSPWPEKPNKPHIWCQSQTASSIKAAESLGSHSQTGICHSLSLLVPVLITPPLSKSPCDDITVQGHRLLHICRVPTCVAFLTHLQGCQSRR